MSLYWINREGFACESCRAPAGMTGFPMTYASCGKQAWMWSFPY
jgi:hypothetical protein